MKIPAQAGKASSMACWTHMVQPVEQMATCLTPMAQQMATSKAHFTLFAQSMA
jgi:hypothetical protein